MRVAILFDGSFFIKKFQDARNHRLTPSPEDVTVTATAIMDHPEFSGDQLFRVYFYDCRPYGGSSTHPLTGRAEDYSLSPLYGQRTAFLDSLKCQERVALRSGILALNGWKVPSRKIPSIARRLAHGGSLNERDLVPNIQQKEVDIKIGLDIAWLSTKKIVDKIVLFTGDSDFVPAMKFARKEGLLVYIATLDQRLKESLREHSDGVIPIVLP